MPKSKALILWVGRHDCCHPGEPAGLAQTWSFRQRSKPPTRLGRWSADVDMLRNRAQQLGLPVQVYDDPEHQPSEAGDLNVIHTHWQVR